MANDLWKQGSVLVLDGRGRSGRGMAHGLQRALGQRPRSFADYVNRTAANCVWGGSHA